MSLIGKTCSGCGESKPVEEFPKKGFRCKSCKRAYNRAYYLENGGRVRRRNRDWRDANKEQVAERNWEYQVRTLYGIGVEEYDALLVAQNGNCAICGGLPNGKKRRFCIDHDHETGHVRGLLCDACNTGIGKLGDDSERLRRAASYIEKAR